MPKNWKTLTLASLTVVLAVVMLSALPAIAEQRHMENALSALEKAKSELEKASHDKGGHRELAIQRINEAIKEVRKGIRYADHDGIRPHGRQAHQVNLSDLEGMRASSLDSTMNSRGFVNKDGYKQGDTAFTTWWNASTRQCVEVATKQGRVHKVKGIFEGNCQ